MSGPATPEGVRFEGDLAHLPTHARDLRALYQAADSSLYHAKRNGRAQIGDYVEPSSVELAG